MCVWWIGPQSYLVTFQYPLQNFAIAVVSPNQSNFVLFNIVIVASSQKLLEQFPIHNIPRKKNPKAYFHVSGTHIWEFLYWLRSIIVRYKKTDPKILMDTD